jgi:hypothetical protein
MGLAVHITDSAKKITVSYPMETTSFTPSNNSQEYVLQLSKQELRNGEEDKKTYNLDDWITFFRRYIFNKKSGCIERLGQLFKPLTII